MSRHFICDVNFTGIGQLIFFELHVFDAVLGMIQSVEAILRSVLTRLVDSQLGVFAMLNFAISSWGSDHQGTTSSMGS